MEKMNEIIVEQPTEQVQEVKIEEPVSEPVEASEPVEPVTESADTPKKKEPTVIEASRRAKRNIYKSEKVFRLDKDSEEEDEDVVEKKTAFLDLVASVKSGKILSGIVGGCRDTEAGPVVDVMFGTCNVVIPAREMIEIPSTLVSSLSDSDMKIYVKKQLNHRLGSTVDFLVWRVDEHIGKLNIASRLDAMYTKAYDHYVPNKATGKARIEAGMIVEARVVSVEGVGITVEVFGVECFIKQDELSWNRLAEVDKNYDVGDIIKVRVMEVNNTVIEKEVYSRADGTYKPRKVSKTTIVASVKRAGKDPREEFFDDFVIKGNYYGTVTQTTSKGVYVNLCNKMDALCKLPDTNDIPTRGSFVMVTVTDKKDDDKLIYGLIKKIIKLA